MYNLIMAYGDTAWDLPAYEYARNRFLEYTSDEIRANYGVLNAKVMADLKSFPSLFLYEQYAKEAFVGYIRDIKERGTSIAIEYEFDRDGFRPIPATRIQGIAASLGIDERGGEQYRTHWAIKPENLLAVLTEQGFVVPALQNNSGVPGRLEEIRFKVAFSFPGELRDYVRAVSDAVKGSLPVGSVFYDDDFTAQLARPNLDNLLQTVYLRNADLIVVFLSADYERKMWCGIEWRAVRTFINNRSDETVMLVRADNAEIPGIFPHDGYIDMNRFPPEQVARFVLERIRLQNV